jgi:hypothetical protein
MWAGKGGPHLGAAILEIKRLIPAFCGPPPVGILPCWVLLIASFRLSDRESSHFTRQKAFFPQQCDGAILTCLTARAIQKAWEEIA